LPKKREADQESSGAFWSGTISFGLVSIPVELYPAKKSSHVGLRTVAPDGTPLRRQYVSAETGRELSPKSLVRGYDHGKSGFVVVTDEELEKLAPEKSRDIDLRVFVDSNKIDPIYSERGYFLAPTEESTKAYRLLATVLEKAKKAGIATFVMRGKEYLIAILSEGGILRAETLRFSDEIRTPADVGLPKAPAAPKELIRRFESVIEHQAAKSLDQDELHDKSSEALLKVIKSKQAHKQGLVSRPASPEEASEAAPDLMAALKKSLSATHGRARRAPRAKRSRPVHRDRSRRRVSARV
jgi:DNA end-binding protein Ku